MRPASEALFRGTDWAAYLLDPDDLPAIQDTLAAGRDYLEMVSDEVDLVREAQAFLSELPPEKTIQDKLSIGIQDAAGRILGLLDVIRGYPEPTAWWIGLLLFRQELRGKGLGRQVLETFSEYAASSRASELQLGVVAQNQGAFRFWQRAGFAEIDRRPPRQTDLRAEIIIVMRKGLTQ